MYWLHKSEPSCYSIDDLVRDHTTHWDGIRNYQARNNMKAMKVGDLGFFYHSSTKIPAIMGIMRVIKLYEAEVDEPNFGYVTVEFVRRFTHLVTLAMIKENSLLHDVPLLKQSRLSVMPLTKAQWDDILNMEG